jgi:uncharacterized protein (DUF302 family)
MKHAILALALFAASAAAAHADDGLLRKASPHSVEKTADLFEAAVRSKGLKVFPRFDHAAAAREFGLTMRPAVVVVFGNPRYGTPLMETHPAAGIDFPPKAIVYEDAEGRVWIAYNSSEYFYDALFRRHGLPYGAEEKERFAGALEALTDAAVNPDS